MKFAKAVFLIAGIYGVVILTPMYFLESRIGRDQPPAITHPEYFYGFVGIALAWQVLFLILSRDPLRYRAMILPAVLEKLAFGIPMVFLFAQHSLAPATLAVGCVDWILAVLFVAAYVATRPDHTGVAVGS